MIAPKVGVEVQGKLAGCPIVVTISHDGGVTNWEGTLWIEGRQLHELVRLGDINALDSELSALLSMLDAYIHDISQTFHVAHKGGLFKCSLSSNGLTFLIARRGRDIAFATTFQTPHDTPASLTQLYHGISRVRQSLPNVDLLLAYRLGQISIGELSGGLVTTKVPDILSSMRWLLCGKYSFDNTAGHAMRTLFGGTGELDLVAGYDALSAEFTVCLAIPAATTKYVVVDGLYVLVTLGKEPRFKFQGDFRVPRWKDVTLHAACSFTPKSFYLSAEIDFGDQFDVGFLQNISFDQAALLIGVTGVAPTLGFLGTLRIRNFSLFGALILSIEGNVPVPQLVSGAIDPVSISIPSLYKQFSDHSIEGFESLEIFAIRGLEVSLTQNFDMNWFAKGDEEAIAHFFNEHRKDSLVELSPDQIQIRRHENGYALIDRQRMRHYFVDASGVLSLRPQFYYSVASSGALGTFSTTAGLFICGRIVVFNTGFEALFSLREGDGLQAYAWLDAIHINEIVHITAANAPPKPKTFGLAENDPVGGLISKKNTGILFFLSASKRQVALSFDGRIKVGSLFEADARIVYTTGMVAVHATAEVFKVSAKIAISASYDNFCSANLHLLMSFDAKKVDAGLTGARKVVQNASQTLEANVENAHQALRAAQARVQKLRNEMDAFDNRIAKCKQAIERASGIKKPLVALAKGVEILAYEAAKAAIWTTMKVAKAALDVAYEAVTVMGHVAGDVLEFVQNALRMANSLIFIRHFEISADIDKSSQTFKFNAELVILGKLVPYQKTATFDMLQAGLLQFFDKDLAADVAKDIDQLVRGEDTESVTMFGERAEPTPGSIPEIQHVAAQMKKASQIFGDALARYRENFDEDLSEGDALRTAFLGGVDIANYAFSTTTTAMTATDTTKLRALVEPTPLEFASPAVPSGHTLHAAFDMFDDTAALRKHVEAASNALADAGKRVERRHEADLEAVPLAFGAAPRMSEGEFLEALHADIAAAYADEPETGCINLALEPNLTRYFDEALIALGRPPTPKSETPLTTKSTTARLYRPRL